MPFPSGFHWGVATSAPQIEGAAFEDGRGLTNWDVFSLTPGRIANGDNSFVACDHYHRFREDVALLKDLGATSYRFSIAWSRILPDGTGQINEQGLAFYDALLDELDRSGIVPNVTMFHWDLPFALQLKGGFGNRDSIDWFTEYARVLLDRFGNRVRYWATFNEPIATFVGNAFGFFAPGLTDRRYAHQTLHNMLVAHGEVVKLFRSYDLPDAEIGIVVDMWHHEPKDPDSVLDCDAAARAVELEGYGMILEPLYRARYSDYYIEHLTQADLMPDVQPGDLETIAQPLDFHGLNTYSKVIDSVKTVAQDRPDFVGGNYQDTIVESEGAYDTGVVFFDAMRTNLEILRDRFGVQVPIYVTENGFMQTRLPDRDTALRDQDRIVALRTFLQVLESAIDEQGFDVRGYYVWTLMDDFEWPSAYEQKYGLYYTDFETQERVPKDSAGWYRRVIASNGSEK